MHGLKKHKILICILIAFSTLFLWFGYELKRDNEFMLLLFFILAFTLYFYFGYLVEKDKGVFDIKQIILTAVIVRLMLLFMLPNLSDDFFRFIWDGQVQLDGGNPYVEMPSEYQFKEISRGDFTCKYCYSGTVEHFPNGMNSKHYYSVYPPVSQHLFFISSSISGYSLLKNIISIRLILFLFECLTFYLFILILDQFNLNRKRVWIYALNPLVIVELTGNLHLEGVTIALLLLAFYFLIYEKYFHSGFIYGMAVCTKLIPLLFIPFILSMLNFKKYFLFLFVFIFTCFLLFLPFTALNLIENIGSSLLLYFKTFEFNASIYYLFRWIGFVITGYNQIEFIGKITPFITILSIVFIYISNLKKDSSIKFFKSISWILLIYFGVASVIHPWYIIYLISFSVFTGYVFPVVWSVVSVLSYWSYKEIGIVEENYLFIFIEYLLVLIAILFDLKKINFSFLKGGNPRLPV